MAEKKKQPFEDTYAKYAAPGNQWLYQNENIPAEQPTEEREPAEEVVEAPQTSGMTLSDMFQQIQEEKNRREKDDAAAEKRGKLREMIGSIGDAAVALNNLYHTTQYAPAPKAAEGMGDAYAERNAQDKAWRDAHRREWLNYALNIAGKKQAEDNAAATQAYRDEQLKLNRDRLNLQRDAEQRRKDELELRQQKEEWRQNFEKDKLDQKAQLAKMNADLKRWAERMKISRSQIAHTLAGYEIDEYEYRDEQGRNHKVKVRTVYNPKTEQLEAEQSDEVVSTKPQQQSQGGGKYSSVNKKNGKTDYTHVNKK